MPLSSSVEVIENFQISPPLNSVPTTSIPLTFFDIPWFISPPIQRILFYEFRHPTLHFTRNVLPKLNHSLSLTLQHYFPLAGTAVYPQQEHTKPYILYEDGKSSVPLIIVESKFNNFDHLVKNYPKDVREFHPLVPELQPPLSSIETYTQVRVQLLRPLIAFQVTIFPNKGICIGYAYRHVVGDGRVINNFVKSWASIFKSDDCHLSTVVLPLHDREDLIKDPYDHLLNTTWKQWIELQFSSRAPLAATPYEEKLRATLVIGRQDINKLKVWIESQIVNNNNNEALPQPSPLHVSTFVVTCAFIWVCLIKTKNNVVTTTSESGNAVSTSDNDLLYHFMFAADCTNRKDFCVPKNYFGNCFRPCFATVKRNEVLCENGLIVTAKAIMKEVKELNNGLLEGAEGWFPNVMEISGSGNVLKVAGSPKFRIYETDFGWGMPKKSEIVHIDRSGWISLADCRDDEEDGIEVGLALNKVEMETFISIFELGLQNLC